MIKDKLLATGMFSDNIYLDKYCDLITNNLNTNNIKGETQRHHIIPVSYFKVLPGKLSLEHKAALAASHKNISEKFRHEQSLRTKKYFESHPEALVRQSYKVEISSGKECYAFDCLTEAARFLNIPNPDKFAHAREFSPWIKQGYIKRRNCIYNMWSIKKIL